MGWEYISSLDGVYLVNWDGVGKIIRSFARSQAILTHSAINEEFHWIGANVSTFDVDWGAVTTQTNAVSQSLLASRYQSAHRGGRFCMKELIEALGHWMEATKHNNAQFQKMMHKGQERTIANIDKSVSRLDKAIHVAKFTRNVSAEFLMVAATFLTGGTTSVLGFELAGNQVLAAGAGGILVGSGMKTEIRWQDDPKASNSQLAATFTTEFAVGLMDLFAGKGIDQAGEEAFAEAVGSDAAKEAAKSGTRVTLAIVYNKVKGMGLEPGKAIIQGDSVQKAYTAGAAKAVGGTGGEIFKSFLDDSESGKIVGAIADTAISLTADQFAEDQTESKGAESKDKTQAPQIALDSSDDPIPDSLAYERKMIEQLAVRKSKSGKRGTCLPVGRTLPAQRLGF